MGCIPSDKLGIFTIEDTAKELFDGVSLPAGETEGDGVGDLVGLMVGNEVGL